MAISAVPGEVCPTSSIEGAQRHELFLHVVPPSKEKSDDGLSPTAQKVTRIAAFILIALGIALIAASR